MPLKGVKSLGSTQCLHSRDDEELFCVARQVPDDGIWKSDILGSNPRWIWSC